jgi:pilus assembly protein CpaF
MSELERRVHRSLATEGRAVPDDERIAELVRTIDPLRSEQEVARSVAAVRAQLDGLGPLDPLLRQEGVTDVLVNGPGPVWVERSGRLEVTTVVLDRPEIDLLVERIVTPLGRRADPVHALVDGRLPDGSRVHVALPPLAVDGPCITIRRFSVRPISLDALAPPPVADLLRAAVRGRSNLIVSGATGSGKTTLLNALAATVPATERIITVEDAAELRLGAPHVVRLESQTGSPDGAPEVTIRELVRNALRMRPDRLVVGEVRGPEAFDLLAAMGTGHDGSLSTVHANDATDALRRLQTLVLMADVGVPAAAVREQLAAAVDLVVHVERGPSGHRQIVELAEVVSPPLDGAAPVRVLADRGGIVAEPARPPRRRPALERLAAPS